MADVIFSPPDPSDDTPASPSLSSADSAPSLEAPASPEAPSAASTSGEAPTVSDTPAPAAPRPRGRPKGSKDKAPRKKKVSAKKKASTKKKAEEAADPFSGRVEGDGAGESHAIPPYAAELVNLPPEALAELALGLGQALAVQLATRRYGPELAAAHVPLTKDEHAVIQPALVAYLQAQIKAVTPGEALALALLIVGVQKVAVLESERKVAQAKDVGAP